MAKQSYKRRKLMDEKVYGRRVIMCVWRLA